MTNESTDYADLVGRLKSSTNDKDNMPRMSTEFVRTLRVFDVSEAADAIETLVRERDEARDELSAMLAARDELRGEG